MAASRVIHPPLVGAIRMVNDNLLQQAATIFRQWFSVNPESEKWPLVTLDILSSLISRGIAPKYDDASTQIVLNQKCIRDHYIDTLLARRHKPKVINEKWLQYGDLLINSTGEGTLGRAAQVWFVPENITVDSHVTIVRPQNQLLLFYIGLWGISHEREIEALHTGSTGQTELPRDRVKAMELRLPDNDTLTRFNAVIAPMVSTIVTHQLQSLIRVCIFQDLRRFHLMDPANWAFYNIILILKPGKECGQDSPNIVYRNPAGFSLHLVFGQISTQIIRCDLSRSLSNSGDH